MRKACVFFVSGHGFGHASRDVEVINALVTAPDPPRIVIRSAVAPDLLARTVRGPYDLRPGACDTGIVQSSSVAHDDEASVREAMEFYANFDDRMPQRPPRSPRTTSRSSSGTFRRSRSKSPIGCTCPASHSAISPGAGSTRAMPRSCATPPPLLPRLRQAYAKATLALELPFAGGFDVFPRVRRVPLVARRPTRDRRATRTHFGLPLNRPVALLSFGGYGLGELDLDRIDCLDTWTIATTDRSAPDAMRGPHRVVIPEEAFRGGFRYEDLVAAADVVVTKPGYGIIAECIAADTAMLYTSRGAFREYDLLVSQLPSFVRCLFISQQDLFGGRWLESLTTLRAAPAAPLRMATDGADVVARLLRQLMSD